MAVKLFKTRVNRSLGGDLFIWAVLLLFAAVMVLPLVYAVSNAIKPMDEFFVFPPRFFARNPTLQNFSDLFGFFDNSDVPLSRYLFNTFFVSACGTIGQVILASACAYALSKLHFPCRDLLFRIVVASLMFNSTVTSIANFLTLRTLGIIDTYWAVIVPSFASPLGLYLMKQFMEQLPTSLMESARLDGASEYQVFWKIVMPNVKPAWLTLAIFQFQQMWGNTGSLFLRDEELKTLQYALQQITAGGTARAGAAAAVTFIIAAVPIIFFLICQSNVLETMTTSGMKD